MRVLPFGPSKKVSLLRAGSLWVWLLAFLFAIALVVRPAEHAIFAQSTPQQDEGTPAPARPYPEQANPAPPNVLVKVPAAESSPAGVPTTQAPAPATDPQMKPENHDTITDPKKKEIADDSSNLVKLANTLKAEVDKTTPDTLSIAVIRHATEIEKLAHKMRTK